jgi:REP element-mobilizing transposase RayT
MTIYLSEIGEIVVDEWLKTPFIRPDMNLILNEFVIMPNHFHGIIGIGKNQYNNSTGINKPNYVDTRRDAMHCVSTSIHHEQMGMNDVVVKNKFGPQSKNLPSIIRGFKSAVTINARKIDIDFAWQPRYHEHIIRHEKSYNRIRDYNRENPENWCDDDFHD